MENRIDPRISANCRTAKPLSDLSAVSAPHERQWCPGALSDVLGAMIEAGFADSDILTIAGDLLRVKRNLAAGDAIVARRVMRTGWGLPDPTGAEIDRMLEKNRADQD